MKQTLTADTKLNGWDEETYADEPKLTRANIQKQLSGDLEGISTCEYVMAYADDGSATFSGIEHITGRVGQLAGTLVLQHVGRYEGGLARADVTVLTGACTDELVRVAGSGSFAARTGPDGTIELDLTF